MHGKAGPGPPGTGGGGCCPRLRVDALFRCEGPTEWLRLIVVQTFLLGVLQLFVAWRAKSLALLGDVVHVFADGVTYAFAYFAEVLKGRANRRQIAGLDLGSSLLSMLLVALSSTVVFDEALHRAFNGSQGAQHLFNASAPLKNAASGLPSKQLSVPLAPPSPGVDGAWMLSFALASILVNTWLARMGLSACGCALPFGVPKDGSGDEPRCRRKGDLANLNLWTQWLHVATDAGRGFVILVCSFGIWMRYVDGPFTDAVLAIVVCIAILVGSIGLIPQAISQYRVMTGDRSTRRDGKRRERRREPEEVDEEDSLLDDHSHPEWCTNSCCEPGKTGLFKAFSRE